jgi:hypothetical protein
MSDRYDMGDAEIPNPVAFGWNVADFDIGDPGTDGPMRSTVADVMVAESTIEGPP